MLSFVHHADRAYAYRAWGTGDVVLLLHGSLGSGAMWSGLAAGLGADRRLVAPDLIGYGRSEPWLRPETFGLADEVSALDLLLERVAGRVHVVGYSYGGAVALELARTRRDRIRSLVLIEPVPFDLLRQAGDRAAYAEISGLRRAVATDLRRGVPESALARFLAYWTGATPRNPLPAALAADPEVHVRKVLLDWRVTFAETILMTDLQRLDVPTHLLSGTASPFAARRLCHLLADLLPNAVTRTVEGAGHALPLTHGPLVERAVRRHLDCLPGSTCRCAA